MLRYLRGRRDPLPSARNGPSRHQHYAPKFWRDSDRLCPDEQPRGPTSIRRIHYQVIIFRTSEPRGVVTLSSHLTTSAMDLPANTLVHASSGSENQYIRPIHPPLRAPLSLTTAALLSLLLAGFTLMALLAYTSPLPSPATLYNGHTKYSGENLSAMAIPQSTPALDTHSASPPGPLTIYTDPDIVSTHNREHLSNSTHSDVDS